MQAKTKVMVWQRFHSMVLNNCGGFVISVDIPVKFRINLVLQFDMRTIIPYLTLNRPNIFMKKKLKNMEEYMPEPKEYSQDQTYQRGDVIYHPVFKDTGTIKKILLTADSMQKLLVDFKKKGSKVLIAGRIDQTDQ